jgi:hypothetical protein
MTRTATLWVLMGVACQGPASGTFVGNPEMSARLADNLEQRPVRGVFEALEVHFQDCDDAYQLLGPTTFTFDGPNAHEAFQIPTGERCGLFFPVDWFEVQFEEKGALTTIMADDFDLAIPAEFVVRENDEIVLRFGDNEWLAQVASKLPHTGEILLDGSYPELEAAFFDGLVYGSAVLDE